MALGSGTVLPGWRRSSPVITGSFASQSKDVHLAHCSRLGSSRLLIPPLQSHRAFLASKPRLMLSRKCPLGQGHRPQPGHWCRLQRRPARSAPQQQPPWTCPAAPRWCSGPPRSRRRHGHWGSRPPSAASGRVQVFRVLRPGRSQSRPGTCRGRALPRRLLQLGGPSRNFRPKLPARSHASSRPALVSSRPWLQRLLKAHRCQHSGQCQAPRHPRRHRRCHPPRSPACRRSSSRPQVCPCHRTWAHRPRRLPRQPKIGGLAVLQSVLRRRGVHLQNPGPPWSQAPGPQAHRPQWLQHQPLLTLHSHPVPVGLGPLPRLRRPGPVVSLPGRDKQAAAAATAEWLPHPRVRARIQASGAPGWTRRPRPALRALRHPPRPQRLAGLKSSRASLRRSCCSAPSSWVTRT
mmetsp:Transcript_101295/g.326907  ORF Transcript_101295/g.326907 Transcript_101295/m.326907 type:complete len:405 (+) Transcript_101295:1028-2242(+)